MISSVTVVKLGSIAGAIAAIWTAVALARPLLQSEAPPFAGVEHMQQYAQTIQSLQNNNAALAAHQAISDEALDTLRMDMLQGELDKARLDNAKFHDNTSKATACALIDQIDKIRLRQKLPIIPPC